jgi:hypothetical protein
MVTKTLAKRQLKKPSFKGRTSVSAVKVEAERKSQTNLAVLIPELAAQWHPVFNNSLTPYDVLPMSETKVWWQCPINKAHIWQSKIVNRSSGTGCPQCAVDQKRRKVDLTEHPELFKLWSQELNINLDVTSLDRNSYIRWQCPKSDDHVWQTKLKHKMMRKGQAIGCPYCANLLVSVTNCLAKVAPEIAQEFSKDLNNGLTAHDVSAYSKTKMWWQCRRNCTHVWQARPDSRVKSGTRCPYCVGRKASDKINLAVVYPEIASQWHPTKNMGLSPHDVMPRSGKKVWWQCPRDKTHVWQTAVCKRTRGSNCHYCSGYAKMERQEEPEVISQKLSANSAFEEYLKNLRERKTESVDHARQKYKDFSW